MQDLKDNVIFFYCKRKGHLTASFPVLKKRDAKPVAIFKMRKDMSQDVVYDSHDLSYFVPLLMEGLIWLNNDMKVPVKILRDGAASQSLVLKGALTFNDASAVGMKVPVSSFGRGAGVMVLLHKLFIESELVSGEV